MNRNKSFTHWILQVTTRKPLLPTDWLKMAERTEKEKSILGVSEFQKENNLTISEKFINEALQLLVESG